MGKRGPAPKPAAIKIVQGTFRNDRDGVKNAGGLPPFDRPPAAPRTLGKDGKVEWKKTAAWLVDMCVLTPSDVGILERYCRTFDEVSRLDKILARDGTTYTKENGDFASHPGVRERFQWLTIRKECERALGLTPTARRDVPMSKREEKAGFSARKRG